MEKLKVSKDAEESRMYFVTYWADFVRTHTDREWGQQHTNFINSLMQSAGHSPLSPAAYLRLKGEKIARSRFEQK